MAGVYPNDKVMLAQREAAESLLSVSGKGVWLESETDIDAVTAVSGSGPAYVFHRLESMTEAGRKLGLSAELVASLVMQTVIGAGAMLAQSQKEAPTLRKKRDLAGWDDGRGVSGTDGSRRLRWPRPGFALSN